MIYGLIKIFGIQFILPSEVYEIPLKDIDGVTLTWAFMGFSKWFSLLLGLFEFVPAVLLLFNKTKLIGAIILFPSLLAIFLINNAFDFFVHMKIFTGLLLLADLIILYWGRKPILTFMNEATQAKIQWREVIFNTFLIMALVVLIILFAM